MNNFTVATFMGWVIAIAFTALSFLVLLRIYQNKIDLSNMLSETGTTNKASMSRFQFLLFTYIIGGVYLILCLETGSLIEIPANVLGLMGISAGSYAVSKGISANTVSNDGSAKPADTQKGGQEKKDQP